jgi:DNA-binding IclR family transcriptional regulator
VLVSRILGMFVLVCFSPTRRILTAAQVAKQLDLSPATVEGVAMRLVVLGCLTLDTSSAYLLAGVLKSLVVKDKRWAAFHEPLRLSCCDGS